MNILFQHPEKLAHWIVLLPFLAFAIITLGLTVRRDTRTFMQKAGPYISVGAMGLGAVIATLIFLKTLQEGLPGHGGDWVEPFSMTWFGFGDYKVDIGVRLDGFAVFGVWMVTVVATCIQWFSLGYMWDDDFGRKHIGRYFAEHSLFATGMLGVVLSDNILTFLIGWEVMGLCSYLLIGFFTYKPSANAAQVKAFITTRIGDVGFMLGIFFLGLMYTYTKQPISFNFDDIRNVVTHYDWFRPEMNLGWLPAAAALLIFMGAVGKSAQFPLHVWLPDAMEGPTPVSALIHAATMVAAGVFLVVRFFWLFEMSPAAMMTVAVIGGITAFGAATIGVVQYDIKRILAYSTISQLGYMMMALGVGSVTAGMFHLLTHAYFKALLFLGSGAVIYGMRHIQDIRYMGGLSRKMPVTYLTFLAGTLALAGIFPFAGFWSKDEILGGVLHAAMHGYTRTGIDGTVHQVINAGSPVLYIIYILGLAGAFLTAFYMFRLVSYTFLGGRDNWKFRADENPIHAHAPGEADTRAYSKFPVPPGPFDSHNTENHGDGGHNEHHGHPEPKEVPVSMQVPLIILAIFSLVYGWLGIPFMGENNLIAKFLNHGHPHFPEINAEFIVPMFISLAVAAAGIILSLSVNNTPQGIETKEKIKNAYRALYRAVFNKYYVDEFYEEYIIQPVMLLSQALRAFDNWVVDGIVNAAGWLTTQLSMIQGWWDNKVVDGAVNGAAWIVNFFSDFTKPIQSGYVQNYMMVTIIFVMFYLLALFVR